MSEHADQILPHGRVLRYPFLERANHWIAAFSYIYLLLTGLAFWSPWLFWLAAVMGGGPLQRRAEGAVLEFFLRRNRIVADRNCIVVSGVDSVEPALAALHLCVFASGGGTLHDCELSDPHLYERIRGAWRIRFRDSRRRFVGIRKALSPGLV